MIYKYFSPNPAEIPKKKLRGKRRYFNKLMQETESFTPSLNEDDWYDMWHYHTDWYGYGNISWNIRKPHVIALCKIFLSFAAKVPDFNQPYQLWLYFNRADASQDAVFFHTKNPNGDIFPVNFEEVEWGLPDLEEFLSGLLSPYSIICGKQTWNNMPILFAYSPELGLPIK